MDGDPDGRERGGTVLRRLDRRRRRLGRHGLYGYESPAWTDPGVVGTQHGCAGELSLYCIQQ